MAQTLSAKVPPGRLQEKWDTYKKQIKLVNPANKRKHTIIVVGTGLAGGSAAATLAELGYMVKSFCIQDSARRAHSIAAQGGINAAKNYPNDGDTIWRLFYDTIKGGDFVHAKQTSIAWQRSATRSSINALHREFRSHENTEVISTIDLLAEPRYHERFTPADKLDSNCFWVLIRPCQGKLRQDRSVCMNAGKCWTWL